MAEAARLSWPLPFLPMRWLMMIGPVRLHQEFKFKVVACWPEGERWWITAEQIAAVVKVIEQEAVPIANEQDGAAGAAPSMASLSTGGADAA
jgi:hypothetical protein